MQELTAINLLTDLFARETVHISVNFSGDMVTAKVVNVLDDGDILADWEDSLGRNQSSFFNIKDVWSYEVVEVEL